MHKKVQAAAAQPSWDTGQPNRDTPSITYRVTSILSTCKGAYAAHCYCSADTNSHTSTTSYGLPTQCINPLVCKMVIASTQTWCLDLHCMSLCLGLAHNHTYAAQHTTAPGLIFCSRWVFLLHHAHTCSAACWHATLQQPLRYRVRYVLVLWPEDVNSVPTPTVHGCQLPTVRGSRDKRGRSIAARRLHHQNTTG